MSHLANAHLTEMTIKIDDKIHRVVSFSTGYDDGTQLKCDTVGFDSKPTHGKSIKLDQLNNPVKFL